MYLAFRINMPALEDYPGPLTLTDCRPFPTFSSVVSRHFSLTSTTSYMQRNTCTTLLTDERHFIFSHKTPEQPRPPRPWVDGISVPPKMSKTCPSRCILLTTVQQGYAVHVVFCPYISPSLEERRHETMQVFFSTGYAAASRQ